MATMIGAARRLLGKVLLLQVWWSGVWLPYVLGAVEMDMAFNTDSQIITPKATKSQFRTTKR
jgi:hypothetical protein